VKRTQSIREGSYQLGALNFSLPCIKSLIMLFFFVIFKLKSFLFRLLGIFRPSLTTNGSSPANRAINFFWSFFNDDNNDKYRYHVHE